MVVDISEHEGVDYTQHGLHLDSTVSVTDRDNPDIILRDPAFPQESVAYVYIKVNEIVRCKLYKNEVQSIYVHDADKVPLAAIYQYYEEETALELHEISERAKKKSIEEDN